MFSFVDKHGQLAMYTYLLQNHQFDYSNESASNEMIEIIMKDFEEFFNSQERNEQLELMLMFCKTKHKSDFLSAFYLDELFLKCDPYLRTKKGSTLSRKFAPAVTSKAMMNQMLNHPEFYI